MPKTVEVVTILLKEDRDAIARIVNRLYDATTLSYDDRRDLAYKLWSTVDLATTMDMEIPS